MKYSYKWLKELSGTEKTAEEIAQLLITHAFEVEDVLDQGRQFDRVVVGEVLSKEKHPDADRLGVAVVNVGENDLQIVCGAPNLEAGQKVPVALIGAVLPGDFEITKSKIRGVESNGMICAEDELGMGDDHEGIMVLAEDAPVGELFAKYKNLDDTILDIDILPNRGHDVLGHKGMAREISALEGHIVEDTKEIKEQLKKLEGTKDELAITIDTEQSTRYAGVKLSGITLGPSPQWLVTRLEASGVGSINNVVDITNYIMLETGQPTHAFDAQGIDKIGVRMAQDGEKLTLLNDQEVKLDVGDIVITDGTNPIALAGVMGGKSSAISDTTTEVIFEVANFAAVNVRKTRVRHTIESDAAYRFERDIDPNFVDAGLARGVALFEELAGAKVEAFGDVYPEEVTSWRVTVDGAEVNRLLGIKVEESRVIEILESLGITVVNGDGVLLCEIPTWRRDLYNQEDLIEEIGRVYGYDKVTPTPLVGDVQSPHINQQRRFERETKNILVRRGYDEVRSYSYYAEADARAMGYDREHHVALINPMSGDQELMRTALMPGMMAASARNMSYYDDVHIFEIGRLYKPQESSLPKETLTLGISITAKGDDAGQFFALKGIVEYYLNHMGLVGYYFAEKFAPEEGQAFHPSRKALIKTQSGQILGVIGEVAKKTAQHFGLKKTRSAHCEIDLEALQSVVESERDFAQLPKFPYVYRDLSMSVEARTRVADVERVLYDAGGELLKDVDLFDLYVHPETGERSMAFHFSFMHPDHTLTAKEVDACIAEMIATTEKECGVQIRQQ